jgi:hypothetical protein
MARVVKWGNQKTPGAWDTIPWYENIEEPMREIVYRLRNNGINTRSSCGHRLYVQGEYFGYGDIDVIYQTLTGMGIVDYHLMVYDLVAEQRRNPWFELTLPDRHSRYYKEDNVNPHFEVEKA